MSLPPEVEANRKAILESPSYTLPEYDVDFLKRAINRPVRMQLELLKAETHFRENDVHSTIVVFGGTRITPPEVAAARLAQAENELKKSPKDAAARRAVERARSIVAKSHYYDAARKFSTLVSGSCQVDGRCEFVVITGGGPGIMEAANRGAFDVGAKSIGLNIELPHEQEPNPYITPDLCFQFHYFAMRKFHFILRAAALVVFPGGYGTLDELFNTLCLRQTNRMQAIPIILYGREYWEHVIDFQFLADESVIDDRDLELFSYAETPEEAWDIIVKFHELGESR